AVDWWSVGVLTYELLTGASPFTVEGERNNQQEISRRILRVNPPIPEDLSPEVSDFISKLLIKNPRERLGGGVEDAEELKRHAFFKDSPFFEHFDVDLERSGILGDGSFSVCRRCVERSTGKAYAVKIVSRKVECTREINLLRACQGHPNIVNLYKVYHDERRGIKHKNNFFQAHTYLVLELLEGGELLQRIRRQKRFTESEASKIMRQLVSAVNFIHSHNVVHRDLKPEVNKS
ncbi:unnamed protein product, partial [Nesidiocoris tenuis]